MGANYQSGANSKVVLNFGTSSEAIIKGLNKMTLPLGFSRGVEVIEEFGRDIDTKITTGATYDDLSFGGNYVIGDRKGQDQMRRYLKENTKVVNIRFYANNDDFVALDLANDPDGHYLVSKFKAPESPKSGTYSIDVEMVVGGDSITFFAHKTGTDLAFVADTGSGATITSSANDFVTKGFEAGQTLIIDGTTNNNGYYKIASVVAGTITLASGYDLTAESGGTSTAIHGGAW